MLFRRSGNYLVTTLALGTVLLSTSCKTTAKVVLEPQPVATPQPPPEPPYDLSPVEAPQNIVATFRSGSVDGLLRELGRLSQEDAFVGELLNELPAQMASVIEMSAPMDIVVTMDREPESLPKDVNYHVAFSVGVKSIEAGLGAAKAEEFEKVGPHQYRKTIDNNVVCDLTPSLGVSSARFTCGMGKSNLASLEALQPYMVRGLPLLPIDSVRSTLQLNVGVVRSLFEKELEQAELQGGAGVTMGLGLMIEDTKLREALTPIADAIVKEAFDLARDLDLVHMSLDTRKAPFGFEIALGTVYGQKTSWTARQSTTGPIQTAPEALNSLPAQNVGLGFAYSRAVDTDKLLPPLVALANVGLDRIPGKKKTKQRVLDTMQPGLDQLLNGDYVFAYPEQEPNHDTAKVIAGLGDSSTAEMMKAMQGLGMVQSSVWISSTRFGRDMVQAWVDLYNDRAVQKELKKEIKAAKKAAEEGSDADAKKLAGLAEKLPTVKMGKIRKKGLPKDSVALELSIPNKEGKATTVAVLWATQGERTWVTYSVGTSKTKTAEKLASWITAAPETTVQAKPDPVWIGDVKATAVSVVDMGKLMPWLADSLSMILGMEFEPLPVEQSDSRVYTFVHSNEDRSDSRIILGTSVIKGMFEIGKALKKKAEKKETGEDAKPLTASSEISVVEPATH